ncbi:hypothetical protein DR093_03130, partial [Mycoplasma flocculare]|nr:hypothetical protein [Mesomycoplasma flocculare]
PLAHDVDDRPVLFEFRGSHVEDGRDTWVVDEGEPSAGVLEITGEVFVRGVEDDGDVENRIERQAHDTRVGCIGEPGLFDSGDDVPVGN